MICTLRTIMGQMDSLNGTTFEFKTRVKTKRTVSTL